MHALTYPNELNRTAEYGRLLLGLGKADSQLLLVLADLAEEEGRPVEAEAWRLVHAANRRPRFHEDLWWWRHGCTCGNNKLPLRVLQKPLACTIETTWQNHAVAGNEYIVGGALQQQLALLYPSTNATWDSMGSLGLSRGFTTRPLAFAALVRAIGVFLQK